MSLDVVVLEDNKNALLKRREIKTIIKNAVGSIRKDEAVSLLATKLGLTNKNLIPISLTSEYGNPDVLSLMYYYNDLEDAKKQLPRYRFLRVMSKDERKKIIDEEKAAKLKAKQAAAAEAKSKKK